MCEVHTQPVSVSGELLEKTRPGTSPTRTLILNKPSSLNALSLSLCTALAARLAVLESSDATLLILRSSTTKAFCAGVDLLEFLHRLTHSPNPEQFFRHQFRLIFFLSRMQKPLVSLLDGVVMGAGAGLAMHSRFRIATERTQFAMPECKIGAVPDVGASYFLSRPSLRANGIGVFLALTGRTLNGAQMYALGLATHFVPSHHINKLLDRLETTDIPIAQSLVRILGEFHQPPASATIPNSDVIRDCFAADNVQAIIVKLKSTKATGSPQAAAFVSQVLDTLETNCPTSVKVSFEAQRRGVHMSLEECLRMEFRMLSRFIRRADFRTGVTCTLISKRSKPQWSPALLDAVDAKLVSGFFEPLESDLGIPELDLFQDTENDRRDRHEWEQARL